MERLRRPSGGVVEGAGRTRDLEPLKMHRTQELDTAASVVPATCPLAQNA
jgi:hypothetical protein